MNDLVVNKGRLRRARKLAELARSPLYRRALRLGVAATVEHANASLGSSYRTIIDVGAHHGQFAVFAAQTYPEATLYCIEPYQPSCERLQRVGEMLPQMSIINVAAAEESGNTLLHVSAKSDSSSVMKILPTYTAAFPATDEVSVVEVAKAPLDEIFGDRYLYEPILLKIDVQGSELAVLRGGRQTLAAVDSVLVECSFVEFYDGQPLADDVISFLRELGFRLSGISSLVRDRSRRCLQADLLFTRSR